MMPCCACHHCSAQLSKEDFIHNFLTSSSSAHDRLDLRDRSGVFMSLRCWLFPDPVGDRPYAVALLDNPLIGRFIAHASILSELIRSLREVFYLWTVTGGDLDSEFEKRGYIEPVVPITNLHVSACILIFF